MDYTAKSFFQDMFQALNSNQDGEMYLVICFRHSGIRSDLDQGMIALVVLVANLLERVITRLQQQ